MQNRYIGHQNRISKILLFFSGFFVIFVINYLLFGGNNYSIILLGFIFGIVFLRSIYKFTGILYTFEKKGITINYKNIGRQNKVFFVKKEDIIKIEEGNIFWNQIGIYKKGSDLFFVSSDQNIYVINTILGENIYISPRLKITFDF